MKAARAGLFAVVLALTAAAAMAQAKKTCAVDGKPVADSGKALMVQVNRKRMYFCSPKCQATFRQAPEKHLKIVAECPILGNPVAKITADNRIVLNNNLHYFCCEGCLGGFLKSPQHWKKQVDVVDGQLFEPTDLSPKSEYKGQHYLFATDAAKTTFDKTPDKYAVVFGK